MGAVSGSVAGLVAITPAAGFVTPMAAIAIGLVAGGLCYGAVSLRPKLGYDDSLDVLGIHGVGGFWGAMATGLFATTAVNSAGANGLFYGNSALVVKQLIACAATIGYSFVVSFILLKLINATMGLRVEEADEVKGLDISQHGEEGYTTH